MKAFIVTVVVIQVLSIILTFNRLGTNYYPHTKETTPGEAFAACVMWIVFAVWGLMLII